MGSSSHRTLGHSLDGLCNRVYEGVDANLKVATDAMTNALALAP
jgi:hypothetical protein